MADLLFTINGQAPTLDQIQAERKRAADLAQLASKRKSQLSKAITTIALLGLLIGVPSIWLNGMFELASPTVDIARAGALLLMAIAAGLFIAGMEAKLIFEGSGAAEKMRVAALPTLFFSMTGAMGILGARSDFGVPNFLALVSTGCFAAAFGLTAAAAWLKKHIVELGQEANRLVDDMSDLDSERWGSECIKFMELVLADADVRAYQTQLVALGRAAVIAEVKAAEEWASVERRKQRLLNEQAQRALERLQGAPAAQAQHIVQEGARV